MDQATEPSTVSIDVLREMVRLAENRRNEELRMLENINKYNLGIIAFAGAFLSLLLTTNLPFLVTALSGFPLITCICLALSAIYPRRFYGTIVVTEDVKKAKAKTISSLHDYLIETAEIIDITASNIDKLVEKKKLLTIYAAFILTASLFVTYILYLIKH